jgi:hypothetical protein
MTDESQAQPSGGGGPDLANYSGTGEDLTQEQREYLNTYALHETADGSGESDVAAGSLAENAEGEWA